MKPALLISIVGLLALAGMALVAAQPVTCTRTGTPARDIMVGTSGRDVLCAEGGNDYAHGNGGNDRLRGGPGNDTLVSGKGKDVVRGGADNDRIFVVDDRGGDKAVGGDGTDQCFVDQGDKARCERVFRGHSISVRAYLALQNAFFGGLTLAEELIAEGSPSPVPVPFPTVITVTETETVTRTAQFPACTPPPSSPPSPC